MWWTGNALSPRPFFGSDLADILYFRRSVRCSGAERTHSICLWVRFDPAETQLFAVTIEGPEEALKPSGYRHRFSNVPGRNSY
jgi:hypothetical protein